jgi:hypothetical protein
MNKNLTTKKLLLSFIFLLLIAKQVNSQMLPYVKNAMDSLKASTGGDNWTIKEFDVLMSRSLSPKMKKYGPIGTYGGLVGEFYTLLDLSNNNLVGQITDGFMIREKIKRSDKVWRGGANYSTNKPRNQIFIFSHNKLTKVTDHILCGDNAIDEVRLDNNLLTSFTPKIVMRVIGQNTRVLTLHQNELSNMTVTDGSINGIVGNKAKLIRLDNNRLNFRVLCDVVPKIKQLYSYITWRMPGNPDCVFDYMPQKPLGGEATEKYIDMGESHTVSFSLEHPGNIYNWELNGTDVALSQTKNYSFTVDEATAGVWRCVVTNPKIPDAKLYSHDIAVFMNKSGNKFLTDFDIKKKQVSTNFPENAIVAEFKGVDEDGNEVFYRLPDNTADNSHFRIKNGKILVSSETLFEAHYIENYTIEVEAYDIYGAKLRKTFVIDKSELTTPLPTDIKLSKNSVVENIKNAFVGKLIVEGVDETAGYKCNLEKGVLDNDVFEIHKDSLKLKSWMNYEIKNKYKVRVLAKAVDGSSLNKEFEINVKDANDAPNNIFFTTKSIQTNTASGTVIGVLTAVDDDPSDKTFVFEMNSGIADNADFFLEGNVVKVKTLFKTPCSKQLTIKVKDDENAEMVKSFDISVLATIEIPENRPPRGFSVTSNIIWDYMKEGDKIADLYLSDPDGDIGVFATTSEFLRIEGTSLFIKSLVTDTNYFKANIQVSDGENRMEKEFGFYIKEDTKNQAPVSIGLTNNYISKFNKDGDFISNLILKDANGDEGKFSINSDYFKIKGKQLFLSKMIDEDSVICKIKATDGELELEEQFVFYNEYQTNISPSAIGITNNVITSELKIGDEITKLILQDLNGDLGDFYCESDYFEVKGRSLVVKKILDLDKNYIDCEIKVIDNTFELKEIFRIYIAQIKSGVESVIFEEVNVYPVPATDKITIEASLNSTFELINVNGKKVKITKDNPIDLSDITSGTYILRVKRKGVYVSFRKIIKM